jgi:hypothetical protein
MTEPEYVDKAVPYFNIRIMERFFGWMGLVEKKEVFCILCTRSLPFSEN